MPEISDSQIDRFEARGRQEFGVLQPTKVVRYSPDISSNVIVLPDDCFQMVEVRWKGVPLESPSLGVSKSLRSGQVGVPRYFENLDVDGRSIRLYPAPNELLSSKNPDTQELECCVIAYFAYNDELNPLPSYFERRYLKYAVLEQSYLAEGRFQDLRAAKYFGRQRKLREQLYRNLISKLLLCSRRITLGSRKGTSYQSHDPREEMTLG